MSNADWAVKLPFFGSSKANNTQRLLWVGRLTSLNLAYSFPSVFLFSPHPLFAISLHRQTGFAGYGWHIRTHRSGGFALRGRRCPRRHLHAHPNHEAGLDAIHQLLRVGGHQPRCAVSPTAQCGCRPLGQRHALLENGGFYSTCNSLRQRSRFPAHGHPKMLRLALRLYRAPRHRFHRPPGD